MCINVAELLRVLLCEIQLEFAMDDYLLCLARLHGSLPQMVIDVLEEKMEYEYRAGALTLLRHINKSRLRTREHAADNDDEDEFTDDAVGSGIDGSLTSTSVS